MAKTLAQLRAAVRQLSDTVNNTGKFPDPDVNDRINEAILDLYDVITNKFQSFYASTSPFTLAGGYAGNSVVLPADFRRAVRLQRAPGTTQQETIHLLGSQLELDGPTHGREYSLSGTTLTVVPPLSSAGSYLLTYTPDGPQLASDGNVLDAILGRFPLYVQLHAAIAIKDSREQDTSSLMARLAACRAEVEATAASRSEESEQAPSANRRCSPFDFPPNT